MPISPLCKYALSLRLAVLFAVFGGASIGLVGAQSEQLDSLRTILPTFSERDTQYVLTLCQIAAAEGFADPEQALLHAQECLSRSEDMGYATGQIFAHNIMAIERQRQGDYPAALRLYLRAKSLAAAAKDKKRLAQTLQNLGILYFYTEAYAKALEQFQEALPLQQDAFERASIFSNLGLIYRRIHQTDSAMVNFHRALATFIEVKSARGMGNCYNNIGLAHYDRAAYSEAEFYFRKAMEQFQSIDMLNGYTNSLNNLGKVLWRQGHYRPAEDSLRRGITLSVSQQNLRMQMEATEQLYQLFAAEKRFDSAYWWLQQYHLVKDSLSNKARTEEVATIQARYENEQEMAVLEKDVIIERNRRWGWMMLAFFLVVLLGAGVYLSMLRQQQHRAINSKQRLEIELLRAEEEKQQLSAEQLQEDIAHRNRELASMTMHLFQKNELLQHIAQRLGQTLQEAPDAEAARFRPMLRLIENSINLDDQWEEFKQHFEAVHSGFFQRLLLRQPRLTSHDLRYCAYLRMNLSSKEIAALLNTSLRGVETHRYRLRKKLALAPDTELVNWIMHL